jgi:hypothetical protein
MKTDSPIDRTRGQRIGCDVIRLLTLFWFLLHFGLTVAYVLPPNPATNGWQRLLDATIGTYYSQNWQLFSPAPLAENFALYVLPLTDAQAELAKHGLPHDGWFDITSPFWARFQQNRLGAYDRLTRPQVNGLLNWLSGGPGLSLWQRSCQLGDREACAFYEAQLRTTRAEEVKVLAKAASAFCKDVPRSCQDATQVALRAHKESGVPWSQRYAGGRPVSHDIDLGVYPIDWSVTNAHIYRRPE